MTLPTRKNICLLTENRNEAQRNENWVCIFTDFDIELIVLIESNGENPHPHSASSLIPCSHCQQDRGLLSQMNLSFLGSGEKN